MKRLIRSSVSIFGMAERKKAIQLRLSGQSGELFRHLLKLYCYPEHRSAKHWKDEIYSFIHYVPVLKHNNKLPSAKFIMENTYHVWEDSIDNAVRAMIQDYGYVPWSSQISKEFHNMAYDYFLMLADYLSKHGEVSRQEVYDMLKESGF